MSPVPEIPATWFLRKWRDGSPEPHYSHLQPIAGVRHCDREHASRLGYRP